MVRGAALLNANPTDILENKKTELTVVLKPKVIVLTGLFAMQLQIGRGVLGIR